MNDFSNASDNRHNIWMRALFMLLMGFVLHVCGTLLFVVTVIQFVIVLLNDAPNIRLVSFGRGLGIYLRQIVNFLTFVTEEIPFPFSEWPAGE
ncbi:MAG: hypothetical protein FD173_1844 [Gallionellaceae bacterium]|nr:MAG: hypothetical protein FD173_1844 [Gallionellaceae bacterium]